jgi:hypothetical protein
MTPKDEELLVARFEAKAEMARNAEPRTAYYTGYWAGMQVAYEEAAAALRTRTTGDDEP